MLKTATSVLSLRNGDFRTVFDGVYAEQLSLDSSAYEVLLTYLKCCPQEARAGVVSTATRIGIAEKKALKAVCGEVGGRLGVMGLLEAWEVERVYSAAVLMSMRGAQPHIDGKSYAWRNRLFWALCLEDTDTEVLFGNLGIRVPQQKGTLLVFDGNQPHCVLGREHRFFMKSHFKKNRAQFFVGGDFVPKDWAALGVRHNLTKEDCSTRVDVQTMLVDQKLCIVKGSRESKG